MAALTQAQALELPLYARVWVRRHRAKRAQLALVTGLPRRVGDFVLVGYSRVLDRTPGAEVISARSHTAVLYDSPHTDRLLEV